MMTTPTTPDDHDQQQPDRKSKKNTREEFCGVCAAGLTALAGAGTVGGSSYADGQSNKNTIFWVGVVISVVSICYFMYLLFISPAECKQCSMASARSTDA